MHEFYTDISVLVKKHTVEHKKKVFLKTAVFGSINLIYIKITLVK